MEISFGQCYSRTGVTQTLKGNEKHFELARNSNYWDKFQCDLDQGKKLVWVSREFKSSVFELWRFYNCTSSGCKLQVEAMYLVIKNIVELTYCSTLSQSFITKLLPSDQGQPTTIFGKISVRKTI